MGSLYLSQRIIYTSQYLLIWLRYIEGGEDTRMAQFEYGKVLDDNPTLSHRTVERVLQKLQAESIIEKVGAARATAYRRAER